MNFFLVLSKIIINFTPSNKLKNQKNESTNRKSVNEKRKP